MKPDATNPPSAEAARFVTDLSFDELDDELVRLAERCFVDTVGVTLAGVEAPASERATAMALAESDGGDASLLGQDGRLPATSAAFVNGTASHALDFDDVSWGMDGHPSVTLVVPILAAAEAADVSGERALTAFVAGFETGCYLAAPISPDHYEAGWHATATFGAFGAAAAAAKVLGLSEGETREALNVAASTPAGLKRNFGSMTKPMHVGQATRSGLTAAKLAARGFTADAEAVGGDRGFLDLYGDPDPDAFPELGSRWALREDGVHVKKYPCCYYTHTTISGVVDAVRDSDLAPSDVAAIDVSFSRGAADALAHDDPSTPLQAKFSLPYTAAHAAVYRDVGLAAFEEGRLADETVRDLQGVVAYAVDDSLEYDEHTATVRVETTGGDVSERTVENPPGTHSDPLTDHELCEKFRMCARQVHDDDRVETLLERLDCLREESSVADLAAAL